MRIQRIILAAAAACVGCTSCVGPNTAQELISKDLYQDYLKYRDSLGKAQEAYARLLDSGKLQPCEDSGTSEPTVSNLLTVQVVLGACGCHSMVEAEKWADANADILGDLRALPAPSGPMSLPADSSFGHHDVPSPGGYTIRHFVLLLLVDADQTTIAEERAADIRAVDHLVQVQAMGHSSVELAAALGAEYDKWRFLLAVAGDRSSEFSGLVKSASVVVSRKDVADMLLQYHRRFWLECAQKEPFPVTGKDSVPAQSDLIALDRTYRDLADCVRSLDRWGDLDKFKCSLPEGLAKTVILDYLEHNTAGRNIWFWFRNRDLQRLTCALYEGGLKAVLKVRLDVVKVCPVEGESRQMEISFEDKKWIVVAPG